MAKIHQWFFTFLPLVHGPPSAQGEVQVGGRGAAQEHQLFGSGSSGNSGKPIAGLLLYLLFLSGNTRPGHVTGMCLGNRVTLWSHVRIISKWSKGASACRADVSIQKSLFIALSYSCNCNRLCSDSKKAQINQETQKCYWEGMHFVQKLTQFLCPGNFSNLAKPLLTRFQRTKLNKVCVVALNKYVVSLFR